MFHLLAYYTSFLGAKTEPTDVAPLVAGDGVFGQKNNRYLYGRDLKLFAGYVLGGAALTRLQVVTPTLRSVGKPMLRPWNSGSSTPNDPNLGLMLQRSPILKEQEEIAVQVFTSGAVNVYTLLWVSTELQPVPDAGSIITIQADVNDGAMVNEWTTLPSFSWLESLPKGRYAVVGSECISTTGIAHRWIFDNQIFRPGALSSPSIGDRTHRIFYDGALGTWGTFVSQVPPRIEVLCSAADTNHKIFLQVIRIGN